MGATTWEQACTCLVDEGSYGGVVSSSEPPKRRIVHSRGPHHRCTECGGSGRVPGLIRTTNMGKGAGTGYGPCPTCDGVGFVVPDDEY